MANPRSRSGDPARVAERLRALGADVEMFDVDEADRAAAAGCDRVALAGGDGSIAPAAAAAGAAGVPVAVIAAGTANDFARRMGLPAELGAACRLAVHGTRLRDMELGWMEERPFVNVASVGLAGPAARRARAWKKSLGPLGYAVGALGAGMTATPVPVEVGCEGGTVFEGEAWQVTVAASGAFGAGSRIAEADPHDGALEVVAVAAGPRPGLVALAYRLRSGGGMAGHRRARRRRCAGAVVSVPAATEWNVDGEIVQAGTSRFRGQADAFRLVVG
ncbi:MAG TPA: diacylglycerol kinase family protein [Thermoleophilaceae bacterium]|nr:diacylglycerol kinase family protein [Thermoleophilaceae bacterium]